jgi:hypothetical protein
MLCSKPERNLFALLLQSINTVSVLSNYVHLLVYALCHPRAERSGKDVELGTKYARTTVVKDSF